MANSFRGLSPQSAGSTVSGPEVRQKHQGGRQHDSRAAYLTAARKKDERREREKEKGRKEGRGWDKIFPSRVRLQGPTSFN